MMFLNSDPNATSAFLHPNSAISWLKKKSSCLTLRSPMNLASVSTTSLPLSLSRSESSLSSLSCTSILSIPHHDPSPPPCYDDPSHPWTLKLPDSLSQRIIIPREEEGREVLPSYQCTLDKLAFLRVKCECIKPNLRSKFRSWRELYVQVYGTKISAYHHNPSKKRQDPMWSYSMQDAEVSLATDYRKHQHAFRLKISNGPQFLFTVYSSKDKFEWLEVLETSIAISADLDVRTMPPQVTNQQRRRRTNP